MKKDIWKVKVNSGYEGLFEKLCDERHISCVNSIEDKERVYIAECSHHELLNIGHCISNIETVKPPKY